MLHLFVDLLLDNGWRRGRARLSLTVIGWGGVTHLFVVRPFESNEGILNFGLG